MNSKKCKDNFSRLLSYHNTKALGEAGDLGPEGMTFISADKSPNGKTLLVIANEVSGTTTTYEIRK